MGLCKKQSCATFFFFKSYYWDSHLKKIRAFYLSSTWSEGELLGCTYDGLNKHVRQALLHCKLRVELSVLINSDWYQQCFAFPLAGAELAQHLFTHTWQNKQANMATSQGRDQEPRPHSERHWAQTHILVPITLSHLHLSPSGWRGFSQGNKKSDI